MTKELEHLEALARVIDPESWSLYDDKRMEGKIKLQLEVVKESVDTAKRIVESGLMVSHTWSPAEYIRAQNNIRRNTSRKGVCYSVEDGMDGYFMHDPKCTYWPDSAIGGSGCIK